ncbi:hypothetical protein D3C79_987560 [compost metagenome]
MLGLEHPTIDYNTGLLLRNDGKVRYARNSKFAKPFANKHIALVYVLIDTGSSDAAEGGFLSRFEAEEDLNLVLARNLKQH